MAAVIKPDFSIYDTVPKAFWYHVTEQKDAIANWTKQKGIWTSQTWGEYGAVTKKIGQALLATGMNPGDKVSILLQTRLEWVMCDIAIICRSWGHIKNLASVLQKSAIPVDIHIEKFFNVPIVKDVLAWGHLVIADEKSEAALFRILKDKMGYEWTSKFYSKLNKTSIDERLNALEKLSIKFPDILWVLSTREKMLRSYKKKQGPDEIIWDILNDFQEELLHLFLSQSCCHLYYEL